MRLKIVDAPWHLVGSKEIIINTDKKGFEIGDVVRIQKEDKITAAVVQKIEPSSKNTIRLDKNLRENLSVKIGDMVDVEKFVNMSDAESAEVSILGDAELSVVKAKELLDGSIVCEGNREQFLDEGVTIHVLKTVPRGIVKIAQSTKVQMISQESVKRRVPRAENEAFEFSTEIPEISYENIGGLEKLKKILRENIIDAIKKSSKYEKAGYKPIKSFMLYGPPGTGKTMIAMATANEADANFMFIPCSTLKIKWYGASEKKMRELFVKARERTPCILFFDEIDAIAETRADGKISILQQLMLLIDETERRNLDIFVIGATNVIHFIDRALLRPKRFKPIEVPPPDKVARERIFQIHLKDTSISDAEINELAIGTDGLTGAQIEYICNAARLEAIRESEKQGSSIEPKLESRHLRHALKDLSSKRSPTKRYIE